MKSILLISLLLAISSCGKYTPEEIDALNVGLNSLSENLFVSETKSRGLGLFAKANITKGDKILAIQESLVYTNLDTYPRSDSFYENLDQQSTDLLAGRLLLEKYLFNNTLAHFYYNVISKAPSQNAPLWSEDEHKEYALRLGYAPVGLFDRKNFKKRLDFLIWKNLRNLNSKKPHFNIQMFNRSLVEMVYSQMYSHSIPISLKNYEKLKGRTSAINETAGRAFIPYLDIINYKRKKVDYSSPASQIFDFENAKNRKILLRYGISKKDNKNNISFSENSPFDSALFSEYVVANQASETIWNHIEIKDKFLILKANRDYFEGEEIRYQHFALSTNEELTSHGFISLPNPYESFLLQINYTIANPDAIEICQTELDCASFDGKVLSYKFNWFQINHRFITFIRVSNLVASLTKAQIGEKLDSIIHIALKKEFYNGYREIEVWKAYYQAIESFLDFPSKLSDDRKALQNEPERDSTVSKILRLGIYQKQAIYKHLLYSQKKWMKALHDKIIMGNFKKMILATHDEEKAKELNPDLLTADDLQLI